MRFESTGIRKVLKRQGRDLEFWRCFGVLSLLRGLSTATVNQVGETRDVGDTGSTPERILAKERASHLCSSDAAADITKEKRTYEHSERGENNAAASSQCV